MKLLSFLKSKKEKGASLVEYAILVALIALMIGLKWRWGALDQGPGAWDDAAFSWWSDQCCVTSNHC